MYYTADPVSGHELMRYGGVVEVVPDDQLIDAATAHWPAASRATAGWPSARLRRA